MTGNYRFKPWIENMDKQENVKTKSTARNKVVKSTSFISDTFATFIHSYFESYKMFINNVWKKLKCIRSSVSRYFTNLVPRVFPLSERKDPGNC